MKYQSEIINQIIEEKGHYTSLPHYESECVESWVEANKNAYPKLTDYQSEWLNYANEHPIGMFPYKSITDATDATVENTVPYAYKSAILKGNTESIIDRFENGSYNNNFEKVVGNGNRIRIINPITNITNFSITLNDGFQILCWIKKNDGTVSASSWSVNANLTLKITDQLVFTIRKSDNSSIIYEEVIQAVNSTSYKNLTELKSVKMPVLTTSNEDGTKTNILTVNEEVTLRGIGNVKDELDLTTGELVQRVDEVIFDGSEGWILTHNKTNTLTFRLTANDIQTKGDKSKVMCDKLLKNTNVYNSSIDGIGYEIDGASILYIGIEKSVITSEDYLSGFKQYLSENPITFQYKLVTSNIKTVELTITNQDGEPCVLKPIEGTMHLSTDGETIKPTFTGEIPVEAITQNIASFIEEG